MALIDHFWKEKTVKDPAFKMMVDRLVPTERYTYQGFSFELRPVGNMLVQELGCRADLRTRVLLHGRMMRCLDVLAASSPSARSAPGRYDYSSAFGQLKGSIFPPRGPQFDGRPPPPPVAAVVQKVIASPPIQAAIAQPTASLSAMATQVTTGFDVPSGVARSAQVIREAVGKQQQLMQLQTDIPHSPSAMAASVGLAPGTMPPTLWLVLGGAALGAVLLATR